MGLRGSQRVPPFGSVGFKISVRGLGMSVLWRYTSLYIIGTKDGTEDTWRHLLDMIRRSV